MGWGREDYVEFSDETTYRVRRLFLPAGVLARHPETARRCRDLGQGADVVALEQDLEALLKRHGWVPPSARLVWFRLSLRRRGIELLVEDESFGVVAEGAQVPEHEVDYDG
jgi:hypothetical protein